MRLDARRFSEQNPSLSMDRKAARALLERLREDADRICARFGLRYAALEAERANVKRRYGICYSDGTIKIRLRHAASGQPLKYSSLISTLCHELAHLKHFNHGPSFRAFYQEILEWARSEGIYVPARRRPQRSPENLAPEAAPRNERVQSPQQLSLF